MAERIAAIHVASLLASKDASLMYACCLCHRTNSHQNSRKQMLEEIQRRNYSHRTARTYVRIVRDFAEYFHQPPDKLGPEQIRQYQAYLFQAKKLAPATVSQYVSALRFLFVKTLRRHFLAEYIPFPKSRKRLPTVLSPEEVTRLIDAACNLYHRTLLMTLYSTAARRAELCRLKVPDIDSQRMMIRIVHGKGGRHREVPLSPKLLETLRVYFRWMRPTTFLFPGTVKGVRADVPISPNMVWLACRQAAQKAGITKCLSPHSLRHYLPFLTMSCKSAEVPIFRASTSGCIDIF
jgi:integrase/recombinase XerD